MQTIILVLASHYSEGRCTRNCEALTYCSEHFLPASVQGQVGWSSEQPGLVEDVPAHGRGVRTK